jgi:putative membrane protein
MRGTRGKEQEMNVIKWIVALSFFFVMVIFGVNNMVPVTVDYYFGQVELPMFILLSLAIIIGMAIAALIGISDQLRLKSKIKGQDKRIKDLERELSSLRHLPLTEGDQEGGDEENTEQAE